MAEFNKRLGIALDQSRNSILKASNVKEQQISLEPKSYLNNTSIQNHLTHESLRLR